MVSFNELKKNLKKSYNGFPVVRVAVLGDTSTQLLAKALRGAAFDYKLDLEVWEADFDQIENQVYDRESELYAYKPDVVILFYSTHKLLVKYNKLLPQEQSQLAEKHNSTVTAVVEQLGRVTAAKIIYYNHNEIDDRVFGSFSSKTNASFIFQLRKLNYQLMLFASERPGFFVCDLSTIQNLYGKAVFFQPQIYVNSEMVLSIDILPQVAMMTLDMISAFYGKINKCLILDLDNTVWGGVIGDDGIGNIQIGYLGIGKAFTEFQQWVKKLKYRGIIICVCSKNTEATAKEPFIHHPDMVLRLDDISVFVANWDNKVNNIRYIQQVLNIGFDSMVFLDDNPFERTIVRENIPGITVPELPEDPALYLEFLYAQNLFETISFSREDEERTQQYKLNAERSLLKQKFDREDDYLKSLEMYSLAEPFNRFNSPRVVQLSQRSNQFNLRTIRYSESDIDRILSLNGYQSFSFTLDDKFGSNGLICVVVLKGENETTVFIESWFMSCRVLKRTMEKFVLNTIVKYAKEKGYQFLKGEYIATPKNELVKDHYQQLGFTESKGKWLLDLKRFKACTTFVKAAPGSFYS
ncbi:MAG: HAD-IIIC family phosphatase [Chitinophagaceae bacterium]|nr:HAD-IIIC family phosphatase [Chitinophagaceae bacterium]